ncbi:MAG: F0F1 ATP synthase subunit B [Chloroflexi bacterium]|nr:F0F1 ATP synthase subunit B [Chloroflexota bacterium]
MEKLGLNLGYIFVQIFNFLILFIVLRAWVYKPILGLLEKRRKVIAEGIENARVAAEARANAEKEAAKILAEAQAEANRIVREATERAQVATKDVRAAAEAEAARIIESAKADAEAERNRILGDLRGQIAALAIAATQKLLGEALDEKRQHALIEEFFAGVKGGKVTVLEGADLKGASAEVISALPLTEEEQNLIKKEVLAQVGAQAVTFRVDPALLGGLVIKVGDKVLDGSVAGKLEGLRQSLR